MISLKRLKKILIIIIIILIIFNLTGCSKNENEKLKEKVATELEYINVKIIDMLNTLNNLSFDNYTITTREVKLDSNSQKQDNEQNGNSQEDKSGGTSKEDTGTGKSESGSQKQENGSQDLINATEMVTDSTLTKNRNDINWNIIKPEIELLNESWSIAVLDLYSLNVKNDTILEFSSKLDTCIMEIKNEDKTKSLKALSDLYSMIPIFLKEINADENLQKIRQTQSYVITAYILAEDMENVEINNNIKKAIEIYSEVMSDIDYVKDKTYKINKIYVLLNELANSLPQKDSDVFYVKYKVFMEAINMI